MRRVLNLIFILSFFLLLQPVEPVTAQVYYFTIDEMIVDVYWESDGSMRIEYVIVFDNDVSADPMEFVDLGVPTSSYSLSSITASIDGSPITIIEKSPFVNPGVALGLGARAIPPGSRGVVRATIPGVQNGLFRGDEEGYASALFSPTWFDGGIVYGTMDLTVQYHLPPDVLPEEPRWHESPSGWPQDAPATGLDSQGGILYSWRNPSANLSTAYVFGASFPSQYVPAQVVQEPTITPRIKIPEEFIVSLICGGGFVLLIAFFIIIGVTSENRRKLDYLSPKIAIEGHGIKRGLTAVEAAILMETELDKVLTMVLFSVIKKGAAKVTKEDPLEVERLQPVPKDLRPYESGFLDAVEEKNKKKRQKALQDVIIKLVKTVQKKMKGFSSKETKAYYQSIVKKAWNQVENAETPEIRSEKYDEELEWTMLDKDFDGRTRNGFRTGPVYVPHWWWLYRPSSTPASLGGGGGRGGTPTRVSVTHSRGSLPTLPGADFAANIVNSVQDTAGGLVGSVVDFTGGVTKTTNPPPPPSRSSGRSGRTGGGSSCACACACACAGCACACAGGGR
jgi:hypothetical protein